MIACPCGAEDYVACCQPLHRGEVEAQTPEQLMRARYSAYVLGEDAYVFRTWHPRTRPDQVASDLGWRGLRILDTGEDWVEFVAIHTEGRLHERSRFERRRGRWVYVDGDLTDR